MKINLIITCLILSIIFIPLSIYAEPNDETEINTLYKTVKSIIYEKIDISNRPDVDEKKAEAAINCIIEIYKRKPDSMEAYCCAFYLLEHIPTEALKEKYYVMREKHLPNLNDPDFETGEKLIFLYLMAAPSTWSDHSDINGKKYDQAINDFMYKIRDNCKNKNYSVLAAAELSIVPLIAIENRKKIIEMAPNHSAIPYVMGEIIPLNYKNDNNKCIQELQKLIDKYGNIKTPNGWRMAMEYYYLIGFAYANMKDYENTKKYYEKIKSEAPDYWDLRCLKQEIDEENSK